MEILTASNVKVFLENDRDKDRISWFPAPKDAGFRGFGYQKHANLRFSLSVSLHRKTIQPICSAPALSSSNTETCIENEELQTKDTTQSKTVHVKFQLRRECSFGQQFLIVGDDPMFGFWDPSNAVPLNWSEGHVWTIELDMPCDKVIKYKFILKGGSNTITWQPGPDRMLQTWETRNMITVSEDWENAELQNIIEEDPIAYQLTQSIDNSELLIVTENLLLPGGDPGSDVNEKPSMTNGYPMLSKKPLAGTPIATAGENITGQNEKLEVETSGTSPRTATHTNKGVTVGTNNFQNNEIILDSATGVPVLVPGLTPTAETEVASVTEVDKDCDADASLGSGKVEEFSVPKMQLDLEEQWSISSSILKEETTKLLNDKPEDEGHVENPQLVERNDQLKNKEMENVLENAIQWGRRILQKILRTSGLL